MTLQKMTGIVLRVNDLGESDKIVTFYSLQDGKLTGIAKGAKKSKKRFTNKLEIFSLLQVLYDDRSRSSLFRIDEAELLNSFISLRHDYERYIHGVLVCELVYIWSREHDADRNVFSLLLWALQNLDRGNSPRLVQIFFQIKLFTLLGYRLHLSGCIKCGENEGSGVPYIFHPARHGMLCKSCSSHAASDNTAVLSLNTIRLLQHAQNLSMEKIPRLRFSAHSIREALDLFKVYGQNLLQREIAAWKFLKEPEEEND